MKIGFIGTGAMGLPMVANLIKSGFTVVAYDIVPAALAGAVARGATAAGSTAEAAKAAELVVTMLPSSSHVVRAYLGEGGVLEGEPADLEEARPALAVMGKNIIHVGPVGSGEVAKLCNNLIAGVAMVAVSEAFRIAEAFGLDARVLTDVVSKSSGNTWAMEHNHPVPGLLDKAASTRGYAPGFTTDLMAKDLGLAVNAAREQRVPVVVAPAAQQILRLASSHGYGGKDFSSVYEFLKASSPEVPV